MTLRHRLLAVFSLVAWISAGAQSGAISGVVVDRLTQEVLVGAIVSVDGTQLGTTTDVSGKFLLTGIPTRSYNLSFRLIGYQPLTVFNLVVTTGNANVLRVELEASTQSVGEVTVRSNRSVRVASAETPLSVQNLTAQEIKANPGSNFDISQVIATLPGVGGTVASGAFRNDLLVRGGGPGENVFYLDGVEIPVINHFTTQGATGGPQGILNVSFIEDATLSTSAFSARYDNPLSSVLQMRQREGNPERVQGNFRLSGTEVALTTEGPVDARTTFLASARRSYLQLLFQALGLPIRPDYWDFQYKVTRKINPKSTLTILGIGAIDDFYFAVPKESTPENIYIVGAAPIIKQWNYAQGFAYKRLIDKGFWNLTFSRNMLDNRLSRFRENYDGQQRDESKRTLGINSQEIENKLRFDINQYVGQWRFSAGAGAQYVKYNNETRVVVVPEIRDAAGNLIQPGLGYDTNTQLSFFKYGLFLQANRNYFHNRLSVSAGLRADGNSLSAAGNHLGKTWSPRLSMSFALADQWKLNSSVGRYYKIAPYTVLGFRDNNGILVNKSVPYIRCDHYVAGLEYVPTPTLRMTVEGFFKQYANYYVSLQSGISLANLGGGFGVVGNEAVQADGKGEAYGLELFVQQKLWRNFFFVGSYTYFYSRFSGRDGQLVASAWDNRHLAAATLGKKFGKHWEAGLKWRFSGGAPYTPFDLEASRRNYLTLGEGTLDYSQLNTRRLPAFNQLDIRIDRKWNFRKTTFDLYLDIQNLLATNNPELPAYTFQRTPDNSDFATTDGLPIQQDGSNAIPYLLPAGAATVLPTIGFIFEF